MNMRAEVFTRATATIDAGHPAIRSFAGRAAKQAQGRRQQAVAIYYAVRDGWRYNPYKIELNAAALRASNILNRPEGHCVDKAILMIAALRSLQIPARLGLAKVRNHIATERLEAVLGTNELAPHGYVEVQLDGRWVKATPAFNRELCRRLGVSPLEWDGRSDSLFQEFDRRGAGFMEYLEDYGSFADVPLPFMVQVLKDHYPRLFLDERGMTISP